MDQVVLREKRHLAVGAAPVGKGSSAVPGMFRDVFGLVSNDAIVRAYGGKATGLLSSEVAEPGEGAIRGGRLRDSCGVRQ